MTKMRGEMENDFGYTNIQARLKLNLRMLDENYQELMGELDNYQRPETYYFLWSQKTPDELDKFTINVSRLLINFISMACGVKDSCRVLIRKHCSNSAFLKEYDNKIETLFAKNELTSFVEEFRNYALHYQLPILNAKGLSVPNGSFEEIGLVLSKPKLLQFDWSSTKRKTQLAKSFLDSQNRNIDIKEIILEYYEVVNDFYSWLFSSLPI
jgi:hypothetical protein